MGSDFRQLVDALPSLIWVAAADGVLDYVNRGWREYSGFTDEQASGHGWQTVVHPDDRPAVLAAWSDAVATGEGREVEGRMRRFDGEYRTFLFRTAPLVDETGRVTKWCGTNTDIEDRKRADAALSARQDQFRSVFDGLPAIVVMVTPDGRVIAAVALAWLGLAWPYGARRPTATRLPQPSF